MAIKFYKQYDSMDCGPTSLRMVAKYYGREISLQRLRDMTRIGKTGVNLLGISEAAEAIGFRTRSVRCSLHALTKEAKLPAILHWNQNHFVVLYKAGKGKLHIADPAKGLLALSPSEVEARWAVSENHGQRVGVALLLEPSPFFFQNNDEAETEKGAGLSAGSIFRYVQPYKKLILQLLMGLLVASMLQLFLPFLTQSIVDNGVNTGNIHFVYIVLLAQLALFAGRLMVEFVRGWILLHISTRVNISILTDFLIKLMKLPISFFDSKQTGDILQRMYDHKRIESFLTSSSLSILFSIITLVVFSVVLAVFNMQIFTVFALAAVIYAFWVILFLKKQKVLDYKKFDLASKEQSTTIQMVQGMQEIKLTGAERHSRWKWERLQAKVFKLNMKSLSLKQWQQVGAMFINEGKNILIIFLSAKAVIDGQMTLGSMLAVQYIIGQLNSPIEQMIGFVQSMQNARISMDRLNEIHTHEEEEQAHKNLQQELPQGFLRQLAGGRTHTEFNGAPVSEYAAGPSIGRVNGYAGVDDLPCIQFKNVVFTYPGAGNEPVLKDINMKIPRGKTTAIVGVSGSGKTTLLKLLLKFYEPQKGEIRVDNTMLNNISHRVWRQHCGVVMQDSFIFSDTIAHNIAVGEEKIDMDRLVYAVEVANVRGFIEDLPLGFNTKIGADGTGISMGQRQRLLIARAVYRDPQFIFFDEATNSLDASNESVIIQNLESFFKGRTVVIVAHRLSTVKHADQIALLNRGSITERGTHQQLTALKGDYYSLVKNQLDLGN